MRTRFVDTERIRKQREAVLAKACERGIKNLSDEELNRVFRDVVSPRAAIRCMRMMIAEGLTIDDVLSGAEPPMSDVFRYPELKRR